MLLCFSIVGLYLNQPGDVFIFIPFLMVSEEDGAAD